MKIFKALIITLLVFLLGVTLATYTVYRAIEQDAQITSESNDFGFDFGLPKDTIACTPETNVIGQSIPVVCDIRLTTTIGDPEQYYPILSLYDKYNDAKNTIRFHLIGTGGQVRSLKLLLNKIQTSAITTVMIVEGDVLSAHAFLAVGADVLEVIDADRTLFMFHKPTYDTPIKAICSKYKDKKDRGQDKEKKCVQQLQKSLDNSIAFTNGLIYSLFTKKEFDAYMSGQDLYFSGTEVLNRMKMRKLGVHFPG